MNIIEESLKRKENINKKYEPIKIAYKNIIDYLTKTRNEALKKISDDFNSLGIKSSLKMQKNCVNLKYGSNALKFYNVDVKSDRDMSFYDKVRELFEDDLNKFAWFDCEFYVNDICLSFSLCFTFTELKDFIYKGNFKTIADRYISAFINASTLYDKLDCCFTGFHKNVDKLLEKSKRRKNDINSVS